MTEPSMRAIHESGHLVCALAAGATVTGVDLAADDAGVGALADDTQHAVIALGGLWAERAAGHTRPEFTSRDWPALGGDGALIAALDAVGLIDTRNALRRSRDLILANWDAVEEMATMLEGRTGYIDGASVHEWWTQRNQTTDRDQQVAAGQSGPDDCGRSQARSMNQDRCPESQPGWSS